MAFAIFASRHGRKMAYSRILLEVVASNKNHRTSKEGLIATQARHIELAGLTPGRTYMVRARAIGGGTSCSDWCQPSSLMATLNPNNCGDGDGSRPGDGRC